MTLRLSNSVLVVIDLQEKLLPSIEDNQNIINNSNWLVKVALKLNIPILITEQYPKGLGLTNEVVKNNLDSSIIIEKITFSAAKEIIFLDRLAALNRQQVILCGIEAHVCVLQTALDLVQLNYQVYVVANAVGSRNLVDKKYALKRMMQNGITIVTKEMVLFECLEKAGTSLFKSMSNEFLK